MWLMRETPQPGRKYVAGLDFMRGLAEDEKGDNRDHHAVIIVRVGFHNSQGWNPPAVAMRTVHPCQWGDDIIEDEAAMAAILFGRCFLVPENNCGAHIIRGLVNRGLPVFQPRKGVDVNLDSKAPKPSGKYGYCMTGGGKETLNTKRWLLSQIATAVREYDRPCSGIDVDERTSREMGLFIVHNDGSLGAISGEHDDSVIATALAYAHQDQATTYFLPGLTGGLAGTNRPRVPKPAKRFGI